MTACSREFRKTRKGYIGHVAMIANKLNNTSDEFIQEHLAKSRHD